MEQVDSSHPNAGAHFLAELLVVFINLNKGGLLIPLRVQEVQYPPHTTHSNRVKLRRGPLNLPHTGQRASLFVLRYMSLSLTFNSLSHSVTGGPKIGPPVLTPSPVFFPLGCEEAELRAWDRETNITSLSGESGTKETSNPISCLISTCL